MRCRRGPIARPPLLSLSLSLSLSQRNFRAEPRVLFSKVKRKNADLHFDSMIGKVLNSWRRFGRATRLIQARLLSMRRLAPPSSRPCPLPLARSGETFGLGLRGAGAKVARSTPIVWA
jgi:hypothetical protein